MMSRVHTFLLVAAMAVALPAMAATAPLLESWGSETYTLSGNESVTIWIEFAQIPVRRWELLVEGDQRPSHLNVRRERDGRLVYDMRDESKHRVDVPWGTGESLSAVLTAGRHGGVFAVSFWGPPADDYLRAYGYHVNRALEAFTAGDPGRAREHLFSAVRADPDDPVAGVLLRGANAGVVPSADLVDPAAPATFDSSHVDAEKLARDEALGLQRAGRVYEALAGLQSLLESPLSVGRAAQVHLDLAAVFLDLQNTVQAAAALQAAESLGIAAELATPVRARLERARSPENSSTGD